MIKSLYVKPFDGPLSDFPKDKDVPEGASVVRFSDRTDPDPELHINVVYDRKNDVDLHLQILVPFHMDEPDKKYPLIVFVPGSAWMKQSVYRMIPTMLRVAGKGYVVAITEYRHSGLQGFPAQTEDAKTAIRFMRLHADEYAVDPKKVVIWGDSSGGHMGAYGWVYR